MRNVGLIALVWGVSRAALALPPDAHLTLAPGAERFLRPPIEVLDVVVDPPGILTAEMMPSHEIYVSVSPTAKGSATLLLIGQDRVWAWDVCVGKCAETSIESAKGACPGLTQTSEDNKSYWTVTIKDAKCFDALRAGLAHATIPPSALQLVLDEKPAIDFFQRVGKEVAADPKAKGVVAGYYGATLQLTGEATRAAVSRAVMHAYLLTAGAISFDDQTTLPASDGGVPASTPEILK